MSNTSRWGAASDLDIDRAFVNTRGADNEPLACVTTVGLVRKSDAIIIWRAMTQTPLGALVQKIGTSASKLPACHTHMLAAKVCAMQGCSRRRD